MYTPARSYDTGGVEVIAGCGHVIVWYPRNASPKFNPLTVMCSRCDWLTQHASLEVAGEIVSTSGE